MRTLLGAAVPTVCGPPADALRTMLPAGALELPRPGGDDTAGRWNVLAAWGRADLPFARLAEGHTDATAILAEAGRSPVPGATYGVWAARSGGTGAELTDGVLHGTVRFCSGAHDLDRALVVAAGPDGPQIVDVDVRDPRVQPLAGTWNPAGMQASDSVDVRFDDVPATGLVGPAGFYTARPGFWWGGAGVAAVWLGGCAGIVDDAIDVLRQYMLRDIRPDAHQLAHLGALHTTLSGTDALLLRLAGAIDAEPAANHLTAVWTARAAAEHTARTVLDVVPRLVGAAALSRDGRIGGRLADLGVYVRQHHGERDLAALGARALEQA